jgi:delta 1-pyrroline-5-carboxylate dehydrogenase
MANVIDSMAKYSYEYHTTKAMMKMLGIKVEAAAEKDGNVTIHVVIKPELFEYINTEKLVKELTDRAITPLTDIVTLDVQPYEKE